MSLLQLPAELIDAVLSCLWEENDRLSLWECSLTCKELVSPAQVYIFRHLRLNLPSPEVPAILKYRPHIRPLIQRLELVEIHKPWIQRSEATHRTLEMLSSHVTSLKIVQRRRDVDRPRFALSCLSKLKCLEKISLSEELEGANFNKRMNGDIALPTFLNHFPKLRAINFDLCLVHNQIIDQNSQKAAPIFQLETLKIRCCRDLLTLDWLVPALVSLRNLHFLVPFPLSEDQTLFCNILERMIEVSAGSLEHLTIRDLDLTPEPNLKSLMNKIRIYGGTLHSINLAVDRERYHGGQILFLVHCLQMMGTLPRLQHLTIKFYQRLTLGDPHQSNLDQLLVSTSFPILRSVELRPVLEALEAAGNPSFDAFFASFPRLVERKMLTVRHADEFEWDYVI